MVDNVKETNHDGEKPEEETGKENKYLLPESVQGIEMGRVDRFACGRVAGRRGRPPVGIAALR